MARLHGGSRPGGTTPAPRRVVSEPPPRGTGRHGPHPKASLSNISTLELFSSRSCRMDTHYFPITSRPFFAYAPSQDGWFLQPNISAKSNLMPAFVLNWMEGML